MRTWLLIDTTDRMDLLLGSQVIDKLLRLPLRFFENRPVGELSQRLSELGNLRGFLTGTAITSALDLLFATIYILIMVMYSPLLTAVALGTVPIYVLMILFIAPMYRRLIRNQAQFAARTQSHLIETLGGIQTVKAQHFELNSAGAGRSATPARSQRVSRASYSAAVLERGQLPQPAEFALDHLGGGLPGGEHDLSLAAHCLPNHCWLCDRSDPAPVQPLARVPAGGYFDGTSGRHRDHARSRRTGCRSDFSPRFPAR